MHDLVGVELVLELHELLGHRRHGVLGDGVEFGGELVDHPAAIVEEANLVGQPIDLLVQRVDLLPQIRVASARGARDGRGRTGHHAALLPAITICASMGRSPPLMSRFQYTQRNIILPQWLARLSSSREKGPTPGRGNFPGRSR